MRDSVIRTARRSSCFIALVLGLIAAALAGTANQASAQPFECEVVVVDDGQRVLKCAMASDDAVTGADDADDGDGDGAPATDRGVRGLRAGAEDPDAVLWDRSEADAVIDPQAEEDVIDDTGEGDFAAGDGETDDEALALEAEAAAAARDEDGGEAEAAVVPPADDGDAAVERPDKSKEPASPTPAVVDEAQANPGEAAAPLETPSEEDQGQLDEPESEVAAAVAETATERVDRVRQSTDRLILGIWVALLFVGLAMFGIGRLRSDPDPELSGYFR